MDDSSLFPLFIVGAGIGVDPFARAPRATRMYPRRDDDGHPVGAAVDEDDSGDRDDDQGRGTRRSERWPRRSTSPDVDT